MKNLLKKVILTVLITANAFIGTALAEELVVYTARKEHLIKPLFEAYEKETGVKINYLTGKAAPLMERLKAEGANTKADLLITVDAGNLWHAANEGLLAKIDSSVLTSNIPAYLRDKNNMWFGLSVRARTIVYSTERVNPTELSTYEALGDAKWKKRLCLRTSKKVYNQSLVAMLIKEHGIKKTEAIVKSWVNNLATEPFPNDTKVMEAIIAGQGDVGIVNTYYFGRLLKKDPNLPLALFWPNQSAPQSGVHVNVSGAGVTANSKNKESAIKFLEWLSSKKAQNLFADSNMEYPANSDVEPHKAVAAWGPFKRNTNNLISAGQLQSEAIKLMDRAEYK